MREDDDDGRRADRPRLWLPPIRLPTLTLPDRFRFVLPGPERVRGSANVYLAAAAIDLLDVLVAVTVGVGIGRVAVGTILAVVLIGPRGVVYGWEAVTVVAPAWLAAVPSASLLVWLETRR